MIRWGLILAAVIIAAGAWFDWTYHAIRTELAELPSQIPSEAALNGDQMGEQLKGAVTACQRVDRLRSNPIARLFKSEAVAALAEQCELIKARQNALQGP